MRYNAIRYDFTTLHKFIHFFIRFAICWINSSPYLYSKYLLLLVSIMNNSKFQFYSIRECVVEHFFCKQNLYLIFINSFTVHFKCIKCIVSKIICIGIILINLFIVSYLNNSWIIMNVIFGLLNVNPSASSEKICHRKVSKWNLNFLIVFM